MNYSGILLVDPGADELERYCREPPGGCGRGEYLRTHEEIKNDQVL